MLNRLRMRWPQGVVVAGMLLVLLHAAIAGAARTPRIVNGLATHDFPTTGALLYGLGGVPINADNAFIYCSGTLIGCRTFLTAAHCVSGDFDPSHYWVYLQNAGTVPVSSVTVNPSYNPSLSGNDVAIIKFATDVTGIEPTQINSTHNLNAMGVGFSGTIAGFGLTSITGRDYGIKRYGAVQTANCVTTVTGGEGNDKLVCWDFAIPVGPAGQDSDTCNGDSGGPLFMTFNGVTEIVGTTVSGSSPYCRPLDHSWDASVYYNAAWIQSQIGTDSTTACGGIGPVGTPSATVIGNSGTLFAGSLSSSFTVNVSGTTSVLRVALNGQDYAFNPNLYVKAGLGASSLNYDCKADGLSVFGSCEFLLPTPGTWSVFVSDASGAGQYQVTATLFAPAGTPVAATPTASATATQPPPTASPTTTATRTPTDTPIVPTATRTATQAPADTPTPTAAALTLSLVRLQPASPATAANGTATLAGSFMVAAGSSFDASGGLAIRVQGTGFDQTHTWAPGECKTNGPIIRCVSAHLTGSARFAPARLAGMLTFTASLRTLPVSGPFAGPVTVTLTQVGAHISRGGTIKTCHPQGKALVCK